ncbi:hypothetical protein LX16_2483 [Stackebrandtia albiflava]|uniref:Uncharacterized protein n=1 Tax=Stackebrandtia albiflava TaxID=406432 RepID=A0A562V1M5_9ACTN|nr:hypothetical protein [Stackebrandtia albiflava]TWJ11751.1 hypothetical protein LX16_2483 [Stackebrandtia albiflava]
MAQRKLPSPFYAAAGASEVVVEQLRKLPAVVEDLRDRSKLEERFTAVSTVVRENVTRGVETVRGMDATRLRETATETAGTLGERARTASERARLTYQELVERGEHVANGERSPIKVIATIAHRDEPTEDYTVSADPVEPAATPRTGTRKSTTRKAGTRKATTTRRTTGRS